MASGVLIRAVTKLEKQLCSQCMKIRNNVPYFRRPYSLFEPDYLEIGKSKIPAYPLLNIQIKGYDFAVLENYQALVDKVADSMGAEVENGWAMPHQKFKIQKYKPQSTIVDAEYKLNVYERNIQISAANSVNLPILLQTLTAALPEGVTLRVHQHLPEYEENRYVPDHDLIDLKALAETFQTPRTDSRRK